MYQEPSSLENFGWGQSLCDMHAIAHITKIKYYYLRFTLFTQQIYLGDHGPSAPGSAHGVLHSTVLVFNKNYLVFPFLLSTQNFSIST